MEGFLSSGVSVLGNHIENDRLQEDRIIQDNSFSRQFLENTLSFRSLNELMNNSGLDVLETVKAEELWELCFPHQ